MSVRGKFSSVAGIDNYEASLLQDAYDAITVTETWDYFRTFSEQSFMFSRSGSAKEGTLREATHRSAVLAQVQAQMKTLDQHSGASYGCVMRTMEEIAKDGWESWAAARAAYIAAQANA